MGELQIGVRYSWIGIEGLPLHMWNIHVFKVIGEVCGGFLEVAEETMKRLFMGFAKIKIKGFEYGLMNPVIEILCEGIKVCLGAFSISGPKGVIRGYRTAGVTTRRINLLNTEDFSPKQGVLIGPSLPSPGENRNVGVRRWEFIGARARAFSDEKGDSTLPSQGENGNVAQVEKVADVTSNPEISAGTVNNKADGFLSRSEKVGRGKVVGLTVEESSFSLKVRGMGYYGESAKRKKGDLVNRHKEMSDEILGPATNAQKLTLNNRFCPLLNPSVNVTKLGFKPSKIGLGCKGKMVHNRAKMGLCRAQSESGGNKSVSGLGFVIEEGGRQQTSVTGFNQAPSFVHKGVNGPRPSEVFFGPSQSSINGSKALQSVTGIKGAGYSDQATLREDFKGLRCSKGKIVAKINFGISSMEIS